MTNSTSVNLFQIRNDKQVAEITISKLQENCMFFSFRLISMCQTFLLFIGMLTVFLLSRGVGRGGGSEGVRLCKV